MRVNHGLYKEHLYTVWTSMRERCNNGNYYNYINYGGRGIRVCGECDNYVNFREWAINAGYKRGLHIDRIDNNGSYSPSNCRWVTCKENARNKRNTVYLTLNGETKSMPEWSDITGIPRKTLWARISRGWSIESALTTPLHKPQ